MTPSEAAEGRRLLGACRLEPTSDDAIHYLDAWLWANREELVRCAELQSVEPQGSPTYFKGKVYTSDPRWKATPCETCGAPFVAHSGPSSQCPLHYIQFCPPKVFPEPPKGG